MNYNKKREYKVILLFVDPRIDQNDICFKYLFQMWLKHKC